MHLQIFKINFLKKIFKKILINQQIKKYILTEIITYY